MRKTIIDGKKRLFAESKDKHQDLSNLLYMFAASRPRSFGVYRVYAAEELDELIAHYEHELNEAAENVDGEHLTRLAQALYIFKTGEFENIWWRIETRVNELMEAKELDIYHVNNITRAFSRSQHNRSCGTNKTFYNLEPVILANLDKVSDRDASHLMYSYSIREAGNPELYAAFDKRLEKMVGTLDYPSLFNAIYYMLFREIDNPVLWHNVIEATLNQDDILPLIYYRPFKAAKLFMQNKFPNFDLRDF